MKHYSGILSKTSFVKASPSSLIPSAPPISLVCPPPLLSEDDCVWLDCKGLNDSVMFKTSDCKKFKLIVSNSLKPFKLFTVRAVGSP